MPMRAVFKRKVWSACKRESGTEGVHLFLFLHFALEFARCPYRILQIKDVDVDVKARALRLRVSRLPMLPMRFAPLRAS